MKWLGRKSINVLPFLRLNASGRVSKKGAKGGHSWTLHLGKRLSWNSRTRKTRLNTPGLGSIEFGGEKRKRPAKATAAKAPRTRAARQPAAPKPDPAWAAHFAGLKASGGHEAAVNSALAAGRCVDCGAPMPPGSWCRHCARLAAKRHEAADKAGGRPARAARPATLDTRAGAFTVAPDPDGGMSVWAGARPGGKRIGGPFPDGAAAQDWVSQNMTQVVRESRVDHAHGNGYGIPFGDRQQKLRDAGLCGARTKKDGTPCLNHAGSCPHHSGARL
jgi:hypothetical protein